MIGDAVIQMKMGLSAGYCGTPNHAVQRTRFARR